MSVLWGRIGAVVPFPIRVAQPEQAVPAGRLGYDLAADRLLLHTIQTAEAFDSLVSSGTLVPDPAMADRDFADAYNWMLREMASRLPTQGDAALWLWARIHRRDLVTQCRRSTGQVLLTCRVPRERVLISHFDNWHLVLNRGPCVARLPGESEEDHLCRWDKVYDELHAGLKAAGMRLGAPVRDWPAGLRAAIETSWQVILDPANYGRFEDWQATLPSLHVTDVVEAVRIAD